MHLSTSVMLAQVCTYLGIGKTETVAELGDARWITSQFVTHKTEGNPDTSMPMRTTSF